MATDIIYGYAMPKSDISPTNIRPTPGTFLTIPIHAQFTIHCMLTMEKSGLSHRINHSQMHNKAVILSQCHFLNG